MFHKIDLKKIAATTFLTILMSETLMMKSAISSNDNNVIDENVVTIELVLSVDVSHSIDNEEFELQRNGYIAAFQDEQVQEAIKNLPNGLAVNMQFWGDKSVVDVGWHKLIKNDSDGINNLDSFIQVMEDVERNRKDKKVTVNGDTVTTGGGTDIALAINEAKQLLLNNNYEGQALVIDVSGDGVSDDTPYNGAECSHTHVCPPVEEARDEAVAEGITINGLPIVNNQNINNLTHEIDFHYETLVVGGEGAFVEVANDFSNFTTAAKNKILREITEAGDRVEDPTNGIDIVYAD